MAYERTSDVKVKGDSLDVFVENLSKTFSRQLVVRNAEDELRFQQSVLDDELSTEDQLEYRKEQYERVKDDPDERKRIKLEMSSLRERVKQEKFADEYLDKLISFESGISSIDSVIGWLEEQRASTNNPTIQDTIQKQLVEKQSQKFQLTKSLLENQTDYAVKDKSAQVIGDQITRVSSARTKALLAGNDQLVSVYDLQLQSLNKAKNENSIEKDLKNFAVTAVTGYSSATGLLDAYNSRISSAAQDGPVKIGDVTYASAKEFWNYKRDAYLADSSSSGFFGRYNDEINTKLKVANSQNNLTRDMVAKESSAYDLLLTRPEITPFQARLVAAKQDTLETGAGFLTDRVLSTYATTYDLNKAIGDINSLKTLGVNVDKAYSDIISTASSIKSSQVSGILSQASQLLAANPTMTPEQAVGQALSQGAGVAISPDQAATKSAGDIATDLAKGFQSKSFTEDPRTTTTPAQTAPVQPQPIQPMTPPAAPKAPPPIVPVVPPPTPTPTLALNKQLDFGVRDPQVKELQKFLNKAGFTVASQGDGAAGFETDYFGPLTQAALKKFQSAQGIVSTGDAVSTGYGRLGPQTLAAISKYQF